MEDGKLKAQLLFLNLGSSLNLAKMSDGVVTHTELQILQEETDIQNPEVGHSTTAPQAPQGYHINFTRKSTLDFDRHFLVFTYRGDVERMKHFLFLLHPDHLDIITPKGHVQIERAKTFSSRHLVLNSCPPRSFDIGEPRVWPNYDEGVLIKLAHYQFLSIAEKIRNKDPGAAEMLIKYASYLLNFNAN